MNQSRNQFIKMSTYYLFAGKRKEENQTGTPLFQTDEGRYLAASKCRFPLQLVQNQNKLKIKTRMIGCQI